MALRVDIQRAEGDELANHAAPVRDGSIGADAEHRQLVVAMPQHAFGLLPAQHGDGVHRAEDLVRSIHCRK